MIKKGSTTWYSRGTGRRKTAVARVLLNPGKGRLLINGIDEEKYFGSNSILSVISRQPLVTVEKDTDFDIVANVNGGGLSGHAGAIRLAVARSLVEYDTSLKPILKRQGYLERDSRMKESKKYGRKKARKRFQFSKR